MFDKHSSGKYLGSDSKTRYYKSEPHALSIRSHCLVYQKHMLGIQYIFIQLN